MFSFKQVFQIISNASNLKHKTILMLVYSSGLRVSEITRLKPDDIIRDKMRLKLRCAKCLKTTLQYVHLQEENIIARSPLDVYEKGKMDNG